MSFGTQGTVRYATILDTTQFEASQRRVQQGFQQLSTVSTTVGRNIAATNQQFSAGVNPIKTQGNALVNLNKNLDANAKQTKLTLTGLKDHILGMGQAAAGAVGLFTSFNDLTGAQIRNERAQNAAASATNKVQDIQRALNKLVAEGKKGTTEYNAKLADLKIAQDKAQTATERAAFSQDKLGDTYANFAANIVPSAIFTVTGFTDVLQGMGVKMDGLGGKIKSFIGSKSGLGLLGMAGAATVVVAGLQEIFSLMERKARIQALDDIINAGNATIDVLKQKIDELKGLKQEWGVQLENFFFSGPIGKAIKPDTLSHIADEVIKSLESQISRMEASQPLKNLLATITNIPMSPEAKSNIQKQIQLILDIYKNDSNWKNVDFTNTSKTVVNKLIDTLRTTFASTPLLDPGLIGAMRDKVVQIFKGIELGDSPMTKLFAQTTKGITATDDALGKLALKVQNFGATAKNAVGNVNTLSGAQENLNSSVGAGGGVVVDFGSKVGTAMDKIKQKADEAKQKFEQFQQTLQSAREALAKPFGVKVTGGDNILDSLIKGLPKSAKKEIKLDIKFNTDVSTMKEKFNQLLAEGTQVSESTAESVAQTIINTIDKKFGGKAEAAFPGLKAALQKAIADPNTPAALSKILTGYDWSKTGTTVGAGIAPGIGGNNSEPIKAVDVIAKRIDSLATIVPNINANNKPAIKSIDVVAKRIDSLEKIKPQISLQNKNAIKSIDVVAKRIMSLEKLTPTIKVKFTGEGKLQATGSARLSGDGSIKIAQHGMKEMLKEDQMIFAHAGEIAAIGKPENAKVWGSGGMTGMRDLVVYNTIDLGGREIVRSFKRKLGGEMWQYGG